MVLALFVSEMSLAYDVKRADSGEPLRWRQWPLSYTWGGGSLPDVPDPAGEVDAAFEAWARVLGPDSFQLAPGDGATLTEAADRTNWVWVSDEWPFDPELLALTSSWTRPDGTLVAFDIRLNGNRPWASDGRATAYDLRAAITHEIGHALGLDHSEFEHATMYAKAGMGEVWRAELATDDEEGARFLYPEGSTHRVPWGCSTATVRPRHLLSQATSQQLGRLSPMRDRPASPVGLGWPIDASPGPGVAAAWLLGASAAWARRRVARPRPR